ncbi:ETC complex I subunit [Mesorhizobium sp. M1307]|uniref:NADH dehydrogenase ubiquinone Fe-S protein 4 n=1 Tax=Mesorhizobium sp. M1307 TaxID=2957079 RepID=UPI0033378018
MTSGRAQPKGWRLVFERRTGPVIEPLMGYTGGADTLTQVGLDFPTAQAAIDYAERQGLAYAVQGSPTASVESSDAEKRLQAGVRRGFAGATLWTGADGRGGDGRGRRSSYDSRRKTRHPAKLGVERVSGRSRDGRVDAGKRASDAARRSGIAPARAGASYSSEPGRFHS